MCCAVRNFVKMHIRFLDPGAVPVGLPGGYQAWIMPKQNEIDSLPALRQEGRRRRSKKKKKVSLSILV